MYMDNIINYFNQHDRKPYPRADESVLYYLVATEKRDFEAAVRCLRQACREWLGISKASLWVSSGTLLVSLISAASGVGAWAALPLLSSIFTGTQTWGSRRECLVREKELELLKSYPELLDLMHQAHSRGVPALKLVHAYNSLVGVFDSQSGTCEGIEPLQAFAGQMQSSVEAAKIVHETLEQMGADIAALPPSTLYPHLTDNPIALSPSSKPKQLPADTQAISLQQWLDASLSEDEKVIDVPSSQIDRVFHEDPLINALVKAIIECLSIKGSTTVEYVDAVDGYKFWRLIFRKLSGISAESLLKSSENLFSALGEVIPELAKPPLVDQIKGGKFSVDVAKPIEDWTTAYFRDWIRPETRSFDSPVRLPIGVDLSGKLIDINLSSHTLGRLLVGGSPGGGKSNFSVAAISSIACQYSPDSLKLILSDVQQVEFEAFKNLPHLYAPIAFTPQETVEVLQIAQAEMDARQTLFAKVGVKNIDEYNKTVDPDECLPRFVIFIEEIADIIASSSVGEFNELQNRFLRLGRKWGFYWVGSTQTPRREVIPPEIRALYAAYLAFLCLRPSESRILLGEQDESACQLLGCGDGMFMSSLGSDRIQTLFVESHEVKAICDRVIALYGSYKSPEPPKEEQNDLEAERNRLEKLLNKPLDGQGDKNSLDTSTSSDTSDTSRLPSFLPSEASNSDSDWEIFQRIREGRKEANRTDDGRKRIGRKSKTQLCQEIFGCSDGGRGLTAAIAEYERIRERFATTWIRELLVKGVCKAKIIEEVYSISVPAQNKFKRDKPEEWDQLSGLVNLLANELSYESDSDEDCGDE